MLPDADIAWVVAGLPHASQCTYRCVVLPDSRNSRIWVSLFLSQCTYRCVVLPDKRFIARIILEFVVSMHLQVRGAP